LFLEISLISLLKGGTVTFDGMWNIEGLDVSEPIDLLFWDYSINDKCGVDVYHESFAKGFFERAALAFPNISAFGVVNWIDESNEEMQRWLLIHPNY